MNQSATPDSSGPSKDARLWGMLCHLTAFSGYVIPFGHLIGPLTVWLIKRKEIPFVDDQGKESLNFQITMSLAAIVAGFLMVVMVGGVLLLAIIVFNFAFVIVGTIKANDGVAYRYPICLRFLK